MLDLLGNTAVGNLLILLAAIIGVGGSFGLYRYQRGKKREKLRRGLLTELENMEYLENLSDESVVPHTGVLVTTVYENHSADLGLLTSSELEDVVSFYSKATLLQSLITSRENHRLQARIGNEGYQEPTGVNREIDMKLEELAGLRLKALHQLRKHLGEEFIDPSLFDLPEEGDLISGEHPMIQNYNDLFLEVGSIEQVNEEDNIYRAARDLTDFYGSEADWFATKVTTA